MREFGGSDALPDLTELLDDNEPQVQREAVRAILNIGTDAAYRILEQALATGTRAVARRDHAVDRHRCATSARRRCSPTSSATSTIAAARGGLPARDRVARRAERSAGIAPLKDALSKGEWWAPRRTAALRRAAAAALARIGTPDAIAVLEEAVDRRLARRARGGARASAATRRGARREATHDGAASAAGRRTAAPLRGDRCVRRSSTPRAIRSSRATWNRCRRALQLLHSLQPSVVIGLVGDEVIVDDMPMAKADTLGPLVRRLQQSGVERITIDRGVTLDELGLFVEAVTTRSSTRPRRSTAARRFRRWRTSASAASPSNSASKAALTDMATIKRLYNDAVSVAGSVWDSAQTEGKPRRRRSRAR